MQKIYTYNEISYIPMTPSCSFPSCLSAENTSRLQAALGSTADWFTSNLLCLNSAQTEFLLPGLKPQLNIMHHPAHVVRYGHSLPHTASAHNLGFIFDSHLTLSDQVSSTTCSVASSADFGSCCEAHLSSQWEYPIFGVQQPPHKSYLRNTYEIWHTDYVGEGNPQPTFGNNKITLGFTHIPYGDMGEI